MKIIISPFAQKLRNGKDNPKNYPHWEELITLLKDHFVWQVGVEGEKQLVPVFHKNLSFPSLKELLDSCDMFISVDSFFPHFAHYYGKTGIVLWSQSDPEIFGYKDNINLLKDRKCLRENQFWLWEQTEYKKEAFVKPEIVFNKIKDKVYGI